MSPREVVDDGDVVPGFHEPFNRDAADIAAAASYNHAHLKFPYRAA
jgi:hypothetical protein